MRYVLLLACCAQVVFGSAVLPDKKTSLSVQQMPIRDVIAKIMPESGFKYDIDPKITNSRLVTVEAKDVAWSRIFQLVLNEGRLTYSFDKAGVLHIAPPSSGQQK